MKLFSTLKTYCKWPLLTTVCMLCISVSKISAQCFNFKKISAGANSTQVIAIAKDGTLWGWGSNQFGEVGNNSFINAMYPVQISNKKDWKDVAAGVGHSLALDEDGKLWGWGRNDDGQLGDAQASGVGPVLTPVRIHTSDSIWKAIAAGNAHSVGITADGKLWVWGYGCFYNSVGDIFTSPIQVGSDTDWVSVSTGVYHFIAIKKDGTLWGWGRNGEGEAGDSTTLDNIYAPPHEIDSNKVWTSIAAGSYHTIALQKNGTMWSWGENQYGELGDGTMNVNGVKGPKQIGTKKYIAIGAGYQFSLAVDKDSLRWAWGSDLYGQFGDDRGNSGLNYSTLPELTDSSKHWSKVVGNANASYNIISDGTTWASGDNGTGEIGDNTIDRTISLIKVGTPLPFSSLALSGNSDVEYQRATTYYASGCSSLITSIYKTGGNPLHVYTTAKVWIDDTVKNDGAGKPFVQRHYQIYPSTNDTTATATMTLYFTQAEFTAYNASANVMNGMYPMLPVDATDAQSYRYNLRIERILSKSSDGSGNANTYKGTSILITPSFVNYANGRWEVTFDVTGFGGFFAMTGATVLPVSWLNVNGSINNNNQAIINWKVNEYNTLNYAVEKSNDGISFNSIATVNAKGNGINTYQFTDNLKTSNALFYRIKQTDKDGKYNYSNIIALNNPGNNSAVSLYPNPANEYVFINGLITAQSYHINISDMNGKTILSKDINGTQNKVQVNSLNSGLYIMKITGNNYTSTLKFIKQ